MSDQKNTEAASAMGEHKMLSVMDIVNADDIKTEDVFIPEWGGFVKVKVLSMAEQQEIRRAITAGRTEGLDEDTYIKLTIRKGLAEPQIDEAQYNLLIQKSFIAIQRVANAITKINGLDDDAVESKEKDFPA